MVLSEGDIFHGDTKLHIAGIIDTINAGVWEYDIYKKHVKWHDGFYKALGYEPGEIPCTADYFFDHLLYHEDRQQFLKALSKKVGSKPEKLHIRLLTKTLGYHWFESITKKWTNHSDYYLLGVIININDNKLTEIQNRRIKHHVDGTNRLAKTGSWHLSVPAMSLSLSAEVYHLLELQENTTLTIDEVETFFEPQYRTLTQLVNDTINYCKSFDTELLCRTARNNLVWLQVKAIPFIDDLGNCVNVKGIFQNIDAVKKREARLQSTINLLTDQNKRLQNFAFAVSHNLRSHTGNLRFMVNLYEQSISEADKYEIFEHIRSVSESLNTTLGHLNEIVKIQAEIGTGRRPVIFEDIFKNVMLGLRKNIEGTRAVLKTDFKCTQINYIPAYLESIFHNLLTNSLKYRHPDIDPLIKISTERKGSHVWLYFEDNGIGIDLKLYGGKIFGMYKTFHNNPDAKGMGLFIVRSQVEALGGTIEVESTVNVGTKFLIKLA